MNVTNGGTNPDSTPMELPNRKYDVVLLDPPWSYYGQQDKWGAAAKFYQTMTDVELLKFPITNLLYRHSVVFMWATSPRLDFALTCLREWGLTYRGIAFVWVKTRQDGTPIKAQGVRPSIVKPTCEYVIAASQTAKGRPMKLGSESVVNTVLEPVREHSRKPDAVQQRIEMLYPNAERIELFARYKRNGWDSWGDEISENSDGAE